MIISHKHKFIFLKTNKTAGTSVEIMLSKFCGPEDVITPISPDDEAKRAQLGYPGAQNYLAREDEYGLWDRLKRLVTGKEKKRFFHHITATEARPKIDDEVWDNYYKFCIERNPWDRTVSLYHWVNRKRKRPEFSRWLRRGKYRTLIKRGRGLYTLDGKIAVDRIIRFENLADDLEEVRLHLGLPEPLTMERAKGGSRKKKDPYQTYYDAADKAFVAEKFAFEIKEFGYEF